MERYTVSKENAEPEIIEVERVVDLVGSTYGLAALNFANDIDTAFRAARIVDENPTIVVDLSKATDFGHIFRQEMEKAAKQCEQMGGQLYVYPSEKVLESINWRVPSDEAEPYKFNLVTPFVED